MTIKQLSSLKFLTLNSQSLLWFLFFITALSLNSCAKESDNQLRGSASQQFSLSFDDVEVRFIQPDTLAIIYTDDIPGRTEKEHALNLEFDMNEDFIEAGEPRPLVNFASTSGFRLETVNGQEQENRYTFGTIADGSTLTFDTFALAPGSEVKGQFEIIFINGTTLLGDFKTTLIHADNNN